MKRQPENSLIATKRKVDGIPAIWLTFGNWMLIRNGLVGEYVLNRERIGARNARRAAGKPWDLDKWSSHFEADLCDSAIALYRIGYNAHKKVRDDLSPEQLIEHGDKLQQKAFEDQLKILPQAIRPGVKPRKEAINEASNGSKTEQHSHSKAHGVPASKGAI